MTLTTHIIVATAAIKPFATLHPLLVFIIALASHYLSDAIPHWDYGLKAAPSREEEIKLWSKNHSLILSDLWRVLSDLAIGALATLAVISPDSWQEALPLMVAAIGGVLPDALQGIYYTGKVPFLEPLHDFHNRVHTKIELGPYPLLGIPLQLVIVGVALWILL